MARFHGEVGYGTPTETAPGVWEDVIDEQQYTGDVIKNTRRLEAGEGVNDNITVGNSISIVADQFAIDNFSKIKYVRWMGAVWIVTNVEVRSPRLILALGGVYNGPTA